MCLLAIPYGVSSATSAAPSSPHGARPTTLSAGPLSGTPWARELTGADVGVERARGTATSVWQTSYSLYLGNKTLLPGDVVVPSPSGASYGAYDPSTHLLYVTGGGGTIFELNASTLDVVGELSAADGGNLFYLASTNTLYVDSYRNVSLVDPSTDTLIRNISAPQANAGNDATFVYVPVSNAIVVGSTYSASVGVVSLTSNREIANATVSGCFACVLGGTYDATTGLVYLANWGANEVQVLDPATWTITKNFPSPAGLFTSAVFADPVNGDLLVSALFYCSGCGGSDDLVEENPSTGATIGSISLGSFTSGITYDPGTGDLYVGDSSTQTLYVVDPSGPKLLQRDPFPGEGWFMAWQIWPMDIPSLGEVLVPDSSSSVINLISASTGTVDATRFTSVNPRGIVPDPAFGGFVVAVGGMSVLDLVGAKTLQVGGSVPLAVSPDALAYDPVTQELWLTESSLTGTEIQVLNAVSGRVVANITPASFPLSVAVDSSNGRVYVGEGFGSPGDVTVYDPRSHSAIANLSVPESPTQMVYAPGPHEIYIMDSSSSNLTILSTSTDRILGVTGVGNGPLSLAYGPATGDVYVGNYNSHNITVINASRGTSVASIYAQDAFGISQNTTSGDLYVVNDSSNVEVIDATSGRNFSVPVGLEETGVLGVPGGAVAEDPLAGALFWLANGTSSSAPPAISAIKAWPNPATENLPLQFNTTESGGTAPLHYAYSGLPTGCTSANAVVFTCTPTVAGSFTVSVSVTDAQGRQSQAQVALTVLPAPTVTGVSISPSAPVMDEGSTLILGATATCSTGACPLGVFFRWTTQGSTDGALSSTSGNVVSFGSYFWVGTANLTVNASWQGSWALASTVIHVINGQVPTILSVWISPLSATIVPGGTLTFTAVPRCSTSCPSTGIAYGWSLSPSDGSLGSSASATTSFTAGARTGDVTLEVNASLNGLTVRANATIIVEAPPPAPPAPTGIQLLGLSPTNSWLLIVAILVLAPAVAFLVVLRRRSHARPSASASTASEGATASPPPPPSTLDSGSVENEVLIEAEPAGASGEETSASPSPSDPEG